MSVEVIAQHDERLGAYIIRFKYSKYAWPQVKGVIDIIKAIIPASDREYNSATKEWTILESSWTALKAIIEKTSFSIKEEKATHAEDFHYEYTATSAVISKETLAAQLVALLQISEADLKDSVAVKKAYRRKALEWHPDRNDGDGSKMSELNAVWSAYNG